MPQVGMKDLSLPPLNIDVLVDDTQLMINSTKTSGNRMAIRTLRIKDHSRRS